MRVLLISHTCQSRVEGQPRAAELARFPDLELCLLIPQRFNHFGPWREAEPPLEAEYSWHIRRAAWAWVGPAQNYLHWYPSLGAILRDFRPDVIDLWEETWSLVNAHTCWLRDRILPEAKIVAETEQNLDKNLPPPFEPLRSYVLSRADYCIGRSEEAVAVLRAKGYRGPAEAVPNAVNAELFRPLDRAACREAISRQENFSADGFWVGYAGRLVAEKGVMDILEALALCAPDVRVLFAGDGEMKSELESRALALGVRERVLFLSHRPASELPVVMNALDALVLPSRTTPRWKEQFGRVIIEAHACATPVIGSDSGAIPHVIGEAGLTFPEGDARALAAAIEELRLHPERARQMGVAGRAQVEANYTWARVAERLHSIYTQVAQSQK